MHGGRQQNCWILERSDLDGSCRSPNCYASVEQVSGIQQLSLDLRGSRDQHNITQPDANPRRRDIRVRSEAKKCVLKLYSSVPRQRKPWNFTESCVDGAGFSTSSLARKKNLAAVFCQSAQLQTAHKDGWRGLLAMW